MSAQLARQAHKESKANKAYRVFKAWSGQLAHKVSKVFRANKAYKG
jgi:hypothetical protein